MTPLEVSVLKTAASKGSSWAWSYIRNRLVARRFKQIFGEGVSRSDFAMVYGELALSSAIQVQMPYVKAGGNPNARFSITTPVSQCELRAISYISSAVGNGSGGTPAIRSDASMRALLDVDFISFGGPLSNFKSYDCQSNAGNRLAEFDQPNLRFIGLKTQTILVDCSDRSFDYGMVLKVHPAQFPKRTWITCAGFSEWGTSGAAWYLANRWAEVRKQVKSRPFVLVVRVRRQQDESAECISLGIE